MKDYFVNDIRKNIGGFGDSFFIIQSVEIKKGSTGKEYLDLVLADSTGDIPAKKWSVDLPDRNLKITDIVKVRFEVTEFNNQPQLKVERIRLSKDDDIIDIEDFIKSAPEKALDMYNELVEMANKMKDIDFKNISLKMLEDNKKKLLYYPAASKNHHAIYAGLLYHMVRMARMGEMMCKVYSNLRYDLLICGVIIHDMEKINEILADEYGIASDYSIEGKLLGHIVMGVKEMDKVCLKLNIPDEKRIMLEHMILSHHYEPEFGSPKKPLFPEAEALHYLDMIDAKMYDIKDAYDKALVGEFSERVWTLDNRAIYHDKL